MNPSKKYLTIGIIVGIAIAIFGVVIAVGGINTQSTENEGHNSVVGVLGGAEDNLDHKLVYSIREVPSTFESSTEFFSRNQYPNDMYVEISIDSQPSNFDVSLPSSTETFDVDGGETAYEDIPLTISNLPSSISSGVLKDHVTFEYKAYWSENDELYDTDTFDHPIHLVDIKNAEVVDNINFDNGEIPDSFSSDVEAEGEVDSTSLDISDKYTYSKPYSCEAYLELYEHDADFGWLNLEWEATETVENGYIFLKLFDGERENPPDNWDYEDGFGDYVSYISDDENDIVINRNNQMINTLNSWRQVGAQIDVGYQNKVVFNRLITVAEGYPGDSVYVDDLLLVEEN